MPRGMLVTLAVIAMCAGCRDRDKQDELKKATGLAGAPLPSALPTASAGKCPDGAEQMGAPRPRGSGEWCQKIEGERIKAFRLDGSLWAEGGVNDKGLHGEVKFFAPDGRVALVRKYENNYTAGEDDVRIEGVELPPTTLSVCSRNLAADAPPTTTRCPPE